MPEETPYFSCSALTFRFMHKYFTKQSGS